MIRRLSLVLALLVWTPAHAALDVDFGRYHALVIGINDCQNLPRLETAVNDASAVADVLRQKYGFKVELLLNPTRDKVIRTLDRLRRELTERDNLLIYYAGHGVLDVEADVGFWMSVDAEEETQSDWISIATVTSTVRAMSAKHVMIVSDSCYSGRLTRGLSVSVKTGAERTEELRRLAGKRSRTALVSGGLEPVNDGGGEGHSVFTRAFLAALRESTEVLDGQQLFTAVRRPRDRERRSDARVFRYPPRWPRRRRLPLRAGEPCRSFNRAGRAGVLTRSCSKGKRVEPRSCLLGVNKGERKLRQFRGVSGAVSQRGFCCPCTQ